MHVKLIKPYIQLRARSHLKVNVLFLYPIIKGKGKPRTEGVHTNTSRYLKGVNDNTPFTPELLRHWLDKRESEPNHVGPSNHDRSLRPAAIDKKNSITNTSHRKPACRVPESLCVPDNGPLSSKKSRNLHVFTSYSAQSTTLILVKSGADDEFCHGSFGPNFPIYGLPCLNCSVT